MIAHLLKEIQSESEFPPFRLRFETAAKELQNCHKKIVSSTLIYIISYDTMISPSKKGGFFMIFGSRMRRGFCRFDLSVWIFAAEFDLLRARPLPSRQKHGHDRVLDDFLQLGGPGFSPAPGRAGLRQLALSARHRTRPFPGRGDRSAGRLLRRQPGRALLLQIRQLPGGQPSRPGAGDPRLPGGASAHRHLLLHLPDPLLHSRRLSQRGFAADLLLEAVPLCQHVPSMHRRPDRSVSGRFGRDRQPSGQRHRIQQGRHPVRHRSRQESPACQRLRPDRGQHPAGRQRCLRRGTGR